MADIDDISNPLSDAETQKLHDSIATTYRSFLAKVAGARKKSIDQVDALAQGRVWMGTQAHDNGLVDNLGGFDEAIAFIRTKAGLPSNGDTNLVIYPPRRSLLEVLSSSSPDAMEAVLVQSRIQKLVTGLPSRSLLEGGVLRLMPFSFTVH